MSNVTATPVLSSLFAYWSNSLIIPIRVTIVPMATVSVHGFFYYDEWVVFMYGH